MAQATVPSFTFLIELAVAIKCFGVATSYLIVVGDLMPDVVSSFTGEGISTRSTLILITIQTRNGSTDICG